MAKSKLVKKVAKVELKPISQVIPEGMKWVHGAQLVKGDVLRMKVENKTHPKYGQYAYAVCTGGGFGCNPSALGNAIYVHSEGFDLSEAMSHKTDVWQDEDEGKGVIVLFPDPKTLPARKPGHYRSYDSDRWERFWGIDVLRQA